MPSPTSSRQPAQQSSGSVSANCSNTEVHQLVGRFLDSFNKGNVAQLDQLVAGLGMFSWYSTDAPGERINGEARNRGDLVGYFASRHRHHEWLQLQSLVFNGNYASLGGFQFKLVRKADDLAATDYVGKGDLDCTHRPRTLATWSMARRPKILGIF
jgi:hypothetical protein